MKLKIDHINLNIAGKQILNDVTFELNDGDILALLGDNGAGKTTLFEIITNLINPSSGNVVFDNSKSFNLIKKDTGVLWDNITLFPWLKVKEIINYVMSIYKIAEIPKIIYETLDLNRIENNFMHTLSKGEKKRVAVLISTLHNPNLLLLDEPTSELDPLVRKHIWENIFCMNNRTILFSTHTWEEAVHYATKIVFIYKGKIINKPCAVRELINSIQFSKKIIIHASEEIKGVTSFSYKTKSNIVFLLKPDDVDSLNLIKQQTMSFSVLPVDLEDVYYYLISDKI